MRRNSVEEQSRIDAYVSQVCSRIRAPKSRQEDIALELRSHLAEERDAIENCGEKATIDIEADLLKRVFARMGLSSLSFPK